MRWLAIFLAGCWTSPPSPAPPPVPPAPVGPPPGAIVLRGERLDDLAADASITNEQSIDAPPPPWTAIRVGRLESDVILDVVTNNRHYTTTIASGGDGAPIDTFRMHDLVPGGPLELLIVNDLVNDGGKQVSVVACGIGKTHIPSCVQHFVGGVFDLNEEVEITTPRDGGVRTRHGGKTERLWFEFP